MDNTHMIDHRRFTHADLPDIRATLLAVQADVYADVMESQPFRQRFAWFVDNWGSHAGFDCVIAYDADDADNAAQEQGVAIGFSYGAPATPGKEWWRKHWTTVPDGDTSTFHLSELMLRPRWRKRALSAPLHDALLAKRPEAFASLTVDVTHPKVQALYESWHYFKVGENQPFADSPVYAVMVKDLRTHRQDGRGPVGA